MTIASTTSPAGLPTFGEVLSDLRTKIQGKVFLPVDPEFLALSQPWNLAVNQSPAMVVVVLNPQDVQMTVQFARQQGLGVAVQGSGHGTVRPADGAILIHTRQMKAVEVDAGSQSAWVEAGAKWGEVLEATQAAGLAPLLGSSPDVGVAGYTLGGGMGWLARKYGLAADSVLEFELVTARGELIRANPQEHGELFWGLRGGGGSLGIITRFHIKLYPVTQVYAGNLFYPVEDVRDVAIRFREWVKTVPDEMTSAFVIMNYPPIPALPEFLRGKSFVMVRGCYTGSAEEGEKILQYWRSWRPPAIDDFKALPFSQVAAISNDPVDPIPGTATGFYLDEISDELIEALVKNALASNGSPITVTEIRHFGGALSRVNDRQAAFSNRNASFTLQMIGAAPTAEHSALFRQSAGKVRQAIQPNLRGVYLNFLDGDEAVQRVQEGYSAEAYRRLRELKAAYDPENLFRYSHAIVPVE